MRCALLGTLTAAQWSFAEEAYPSKPLRIIVPLPPGGAVDIGVRILNEQLQTILKQPTIVETKPGGVYTIGMQALTQAPADGYTLIATNTSFVAVQLLHNRFDIRTQLVPVSTWSQIDVILTASPNAPFSSLKEMIAWAKANPGKLNYGSVGPGTIEHLLMANLVRKYGLDATHVPFKGGPDFMIALVRDDIQVVAAVVPLVNQHKNRVRPMAVMSEKRTPLFPEVPTLKEAGIEVPNFRFWNGLAAAAGTSPAVVETLQRAIEQALKSEVAQAKYAEFGMTPRASTSAQFAQTINEDFRWLANAIRDADVKLN
jgi:tripartite-type tricarboxylate transporter receptor subunit TctC